MKMEKDIEAIVSELMKREDRKDPEFRYALLSTEIGDIGKYMTHDPKLNPNARPHGSKEDEKLAYGQAIAMLMGLCHARGINYNEALELGLKNWVDADWRRRTSHGQEIKGLAAVQGYVRANAYVVSKEHPLDELKNPSIIVMEFAKPDFIIAKDYIKGIVTDHGGCACHAANIAREYSIPCIVGTGNATGLIKHGDMLELDSDIEKGEGIVKVL
jgi:phosphohistidine swiveling domain-containing protein